MVVILQVFYSVFSGMMLALAIPNEFYLLGFPFITLFALTPFYLSIKLSKDFRYAFLTGFIQTITTHLCSSFWLAFFKDFAAVTLGASAFGTGCIGGIMGLLFYLPYSSLKSKNPLNEYCLHKPRIENSCFKIIYFAAIYTLYEWVKSNGFLGYPWATLASTMYKWPEMMQISDITGIYGIAFIFAFANGLLGEFLHILKTPVPALDRSRRRDFVLAARLFLIIFGATYIYGLYQCNKTRIPQKFISTIIVQQNSDPWKQQTDRESILLSQRLTKESYSELQEAGKKPDLVVWSEGVLKYHFPKNTKHYDKAPAEKPLTDFIREINTPLLAGGSWVRQTDDTKFYFNSAIVFDEKGNIRGHYAKNHLVPCAEAIPGMEIPAIRAFMSKVIHISAGWTPGDQYVFFDIPCSYNPERILPAVDNFDLSVPYVTEKNILEQRPTVKISTPICFDDCFPDIMGPLFKNGCEVFMNITDDSWSLKKSSEYQHFVNSVYSSIQYRTTMVRATNSGYSVVLDPTGKILAELPLFEEASMAYDVPIYQRHKTTYSTFGNWLPYVIIFLTLVYCLYLETNFTPSDYVPSERKIKNKKSKKHHKK